MITKKAYKSRKSYHSLMASARVLFMKFGMRKVSVEEICKEAGVSKMTFYRMFSNKRELLIEWLHDLYSKGLEDYKQVMAQNIDFPEKIKQILILKHEAATGMSQEFLLELYKSEDEELQNMLAHYQEISTQQTYQDFRQAQNDGWIRKELKIDTIFFLMQVVQEKLFDPQYLALHTNTHDAIMELTNFFFYGIMAHQGQTHAQD